MITWTAPANTGGLPFYYYLFLNEYPLLVSNNQLSILGNLTANTEYRVTVAAFNELGEGGNVTGIGLTRPEGINKKRYIYTYVLCLRNIKVKIE